MATKENGMFINNNKSNNDQFHTIGEEVRINSNFIKSIFPQLMIIDKRLAKSLIYSVEESSLFKQLRFVRKYSEKQVAEKLKSLLEIINLFQNINEVVREENEKNYLKLADDEFRKGNYQKMKFWLQMAADSGDSTAINLLDKLKV